MFITIDNNIIEKLSRTELAVIRFINENKNRLSKLSIVDIACETFCSPATVSRAIRKCGLNGFNELRYKLALEDKDNITYSTVEVLNKSLIEAQRVIEQISLESLENIKNKLMSSRRIYIIARGLTSHVAEEFMFKLELLDFNAFSTTSQAPVDLYACLPDITISLSIPFDLKSLAISSILLIAPQPK